MRTGKLPSKWDNFLDIRFFLSGEEFGFIHSEVVDNVPHEEIQNRRVDASALPVRIQYSKKKIAGAIGKFRIYAVVFQERRAIE
jgi:hypothetical protein